MDGGTVWNTNLVSAVEKCRSMGYSDKQITLDIITCGFKDQKPYTLSKNAYSNQLRYQNLKSTQ